MKRLAPRCVAPIAPVAAMAPIAPVAAMVPLALLTPIAPIALLADPVLAEGFDWPQWQGQDRNATSREQGLLREWPEAGPPLAWRKEGLGGGYGAPAIASGRIIAMSSRGADEVVWALSEVAREELWATRLGPALREGMPQGSEGEARQSREVMAGSRGGASTRLPSRARAPSA